MANLKEIRTRISSVVSTRQITSAMKMVSAAKLRRAQDSILLMRPYADKLQDVLLKLSDSIEDLSDNEFAAHKEVKSILLIAISSNKGLCGAFNANVAKRIIQLIEEDFHSEYKSGQLDIICIGKKASEILRIKGYRILENHHDIFEKLSFDKILPLADAILDSYKTGRYDSVSIVYNQFKNAAVQELTSEQLLPIDKPVEANSKDRNANYILEPSKEDIIKVLIPKLIKIQLYKALLDSNASEQGARMTAMHKATDNATEIIKQLNLDYNKARQASITKEILEIVAGAEAQNG